MYDNTIIKQAELVPENGFDVKKDNTTIFTDNVVRSYLVYKYGSFICPDMYSKFTFYVASTVDDLARAAAAWSAVYNPLDNYNGETERVTTDTHGDETKTHTTGGLDGTHKTITSSALDNTYTKHDTTTFDSTTLRTESQDSQHGGTVSTDDLHTEDKTSHTDVTKTVSGVSYSGDNIHTEIENKHGNLGVTTSQQMIMSEIDMRLNPLLNQYLDRFVYQYAYYTGGAWGECGDFI